MEGVVVGVCDGGGLMGDLGGTKGASKEVHPALSTWHTWTVNSHTFSVAGLVRCTLTFKRRVTQGSVLPGRRWSYRKRRRDHRGITCRLLDWESVKIFSRWEGWERGVASRLLVNEGGA